MDEIRLIIADDHRLFRSGLRQLIERHGGVRVVAEAASGLEAVTAAKELAPDIVVMDISMPELNGIEATRRIGEEAPSVRVIVLSMHSDQRYVHEALRSGAKGYLLKDSAPEELMLALRKVMRGQFYLSAAISTRVIEGFIQTAPHEAPSVFGVLSPREREVLQLLAEGKSTRDIAEKLNLSGKTVETHRMHLMEKLNLHTIAELTRYAIREGLTPLD
jgi:DNA-binding NarL/FixJ family response regulator